MQVKCPGCKNPYKVDDHRIPDNGLKMRCPKCQTVFKVVKKATSTPPVKPTSTGNTSQKLKSVLSTTSTKRLGRPSSSVSGPAMPPVPMPDPPFPPNPPKGGRGAGPEPEIKTPKKKESVFGKIELDIPDVPKTPESGRAPTVTGEFDPLTENIDDLNLDPTENDRAAVSSPPDEIISAPPTAISAPPKTPNDSPDNSDDEFFDLSDFDDIPSASKRDARGDLISLPPNDSTPPPDTDLLDLDLEPAGGPQTGISLSDTAENMSDENVEDITDEIVEDISDEIMDHIDLDEDLGENISARPSLALVENNMFSSESTSPPPPMNDPDGSEIDFDSTLAKSDAFGMHHTEDLDLQDSTEEEALPLELDASPEDFGDIGLPSLEPSPSVRTPTTDLSQSTGSLPPALGEYSLTDDDEMDAIPSPADLLDDSEPMVDGGNTVERSAARDSSDFDEVDLVPKTGEASLPLDLDDGEEFDAFPTKTSPNDLGSESKIDLAADPLHVRTTAPSTVLDAGKNPDDTKDRRPEKTFEGRRKLERQSRRMKVILFFLLFLLIAAGGALSFTEYGPFGANFLFRLIPKATDKNVVAQIVKKADAAIRKDTHDALEAAIKEAHAGYMEYTASEDLQLLTVYLCYLKQIQFGIDKKTEDIAVRVLGATNLDMAQSPYAPLAKVSQYIRFSKPLSLREPLLSNLNKTPNGLGLLVSFHLFEDNLPAALAAAKKLEQQEKSPRAGALLNGVRLRMADEKNAAKAALHLAELHKQYPKHAGITLLYTDALICQKPRDTKGAFGLIAELLEPRTPPLLPGQLAQVHALKARLSFLNREYKEASANIEKAEQLDPENLTMSLIKGRVALLRKDFSTADMCFKKVLAEHPHDMEATLGKIETAVRSGEYAKSRNSLTDILKKDRRNAYANYLMGEIQSLNHENDAAIQSLQTAVQSDETLLEAYISLSNLYIRINDNPKAMETLDKASEEFTDSPLIKKTLAAAHATRGDFPAAIIELDNALKLDPEDVEAHFLMARMYREMKSFTDAANALEEVEKRNPEYPGLALEQGRLLEFSGNVAQALSAYKKALSQTPNDIYLKLRVGVASHLVGDTETARKELLSVLEANPTSPEANFYTGETYRLAGASTEAASYLKRASELDPKNALYLLRYGLALTDSKDLDKAMEVLEAAIRIDEKLGEAYVAIGKIRLRQGGPRDAIFWVEKGLSIDPNIRTGYLTVAEAFEQISKPASAVHYYRKATEMEPKNATIKFKLGLAELVVQGYPAAAGTLDAAVKLAEDDEPKPAWYPEALYRLGVAEKKRGQRNAAIDAFKKYLEIAPENHIDRSEVRANLDELTTSASISLH